MTVHGLRPEFQPSNFAKQEEQLAEAKVVEILQTTGEHEGVASVHKASGLTGLGQSVDIKS